MLSGEAKRRYIRGPRTDFGVVGMGGREVEEVREGFGDEVEAGWRGQGRSVQLSNGADGREVTRNRKRQQKRITLGELRKRIRPQRSQQLRRRRNRAQVTK